MAWGRWFAFSCWRAMSSWRLSCRRGSVCAMLSKERWLMSRTTMTKCSCALISAAPAFSLALRKRLSKHYGFSAGRACGRSSRRCPCAGTRSGVPRPRLQRPDKRLQEAVGLVAIHDAVVDCQRDVAPRTHLDFLFLAVLDHHRAFL